MFDGRPVAQVAAGLGVSRQCAYRWVGRYRRQGWDGLADRRSGPRTSPSKTAAQTEECWRPAASCGPDHLVADTGVPARTVTRILRRHGVPVPAACDPVTGHQIRATRHSDRRYDPPEPSAMIHLDVKKLGRIPDGGGRRVHGRSEAVRGRGIGYDHAPPPSTTTPGWPTRRCCPMTRAPPARRSRPGRRRSSPPTASPASTGCRPTTPRNHRNSAPFQQACAELGTRQKFTRPRCPWTHGKAERLNRTLATERAYQRPYTSNDQPTPALAAWLEHYNTQHPPPDPGRQAIHHPTVTKIMTEYT